MISWSFESQASEYCKKLQQGVKDTEKSLPLVSPGSYDPLSRFLGVLLRGL